ncbi:MAG: hypothetical protein QHC67_11275 [Sphingobium sp.]|uniref:hypothetical protein n=1 Tax=Sphingobium sp. TaxID=1912891 RepID=UPI0029B27CDC|nr:hypothetical protein [Sphingobium sp.]MDX3910389.1 hypothetical protein [Sphingobium sp.]
MMFGVASNNVAQAQAPGQAVYIVLPVTTDIARADKIGNKGAGLLCMPNGTLNGEDIQSELAGGAQSVVDSLKTAGLSAITSEGFSPEISEASAYRTRWVKVAIKSATFSVCAKKWGLGNKRGYTGSATLQLNWAIRDMAHGGIGSGWSREVTMQSTSSDPKSIAQFVSAAVAKSFDADKIPR